MFMFLLLYPGYPSLDIPMLAENNRLGCTMLFIHCHEIKNLLHDLICFHFLSSIILDDLSNCLQGHNE